MKPSKRANVRDVAHLARVSVATVSRVINTPDLVRKDTRQKVEAAIIELGFVRSSAARSFSTGRTHVVGALVPTLESDLFALTIDAIERRLADFGLSLVVATTGDDPKEEIEKARRLLDTGVEGVFLSGVLHDPELDELLIKHRMPALAISNFQADYRYPTVGYDNSEAARLGMEHLIASGAGRIAVVHSQGQTNDRIRDRLKGVENAAKDLPVQYVETELSIAGGADAARQILAEQNMPAAVMCVSDVLALGVHFEFGRCGIRIPEDCALMGLHDLPIAEYLAPRLSTVRLPATEMGSEAARALAHWIETGKRPPHTLIASELVIRDTA